MKMKLIKVAKKVDSDKDIIIQKLAQVWGGLMDAKVRLKKLDDDKLRKYTSVCEKMADQVDKIMKELNKGGVSY